VTIVESHATSQCYNFSLISDVPYLFLARFGRRSLESKTAGFNLTLVYDHMSETLNTLLVHNVH